MRQAKPVPGLDRVSSQVSSLPLHTALPKLRYHCCSISCAKAPCYPGAFLSISQCPSPTGWVCYSVLAAQLHRWASPDPCRCSICRGKCPPPRGEGDAATGCGGRAGSQGASPPTTAVCHTSPPPPCLCFKRHCPTQLVAATFCVPPRVLSILGQCFFTHHSTTSRLQRLHLCLLPLPLVSLPRTCRLFPV